jgi:hypothetical protein
MVAAMLSLLQFQKSGCQYLIGAWMHEQKFTMLAVVNCCTISSNLIYYIGAGWGERTTPVKSDI